ncbi:hypothetical protein AK830_g12177 [Neonectria ditissima]|uniref:Wings apart-like protein C-terminal domain-containing protein n=1 Tax=Neonectria ditissima TaxID=78410 RepID=A0A0N8H4V0_9HYPO|nr:hypothetical protein AK830_g12177 [Neonectria ditissima]
MASRASSAMPAQKKLVTYGKASRKRHLREPIPLRAAESIASSSDRPSTSATAVVTIEDVAKPSKPRGSAPLPNPSPKPSASHRSTVQYGRDRAGPAQGRDTESRDDAIMRKRKRPEAAPSDAIYDIPTDPSPQKRSKPPISIPRPRQVALKSSASSNSEPLQRIATTKDSSRSTSKRARPVDVVSNNPLDSGARSGPPPSTRSHGDGGTSSQTRRPRLIDALAAQRPNSPESDSSLEDEGLTQSSLFSGSGTPSQQPPALARDDSLSRPKARPGVILQGKRVKYTYGETRTILNDSQKTVDSGMGSCEDELDALLATPPALSQPDPFSFGDDDVDLDGDIRPAIKSVHELRRAGANNRFADEMEDLLARIGTPSNGPSSLRRNALLELAQKLQRKEFISQFRDHATRDKVAIDVGHEVDVVSGFALTSILVTFLNFNPAAHLLRQLSEDGLGKMLGLLLRIPEDVDALASQKKMRLSGATKRSLAEVKATMMRMDIWQGRRLEELSPQTLGLQLLNILCRRVDPGYSAGVVKDTKRDLTAIMEHYTDADVGQDAVFALVVSILETQSTLTMDNDDEVSWILQQTPKIAQFLSNALDKWSEKPTSMQSTIIKLAINTSNTAQGAAGLNNRTLLLRLSSRICAGFKSAQEAVSNRSLRSESYDGLLLILGVMINILEHCPPARENVDGGSLESLLTLYEQNKASTSEADSVEKSQLSVAVGYLAVLLGYLSLVGSVRRRLAELTGGEGVSGLIGSILEFIEVAEDGEDDKRTSQHDNESGSFPLDRTLLRGGNPVTSYMHTGSRARPTNADLVMPIDIPWVFYLGGGGVRSATKLASTGTLETWPG